MKPTSVYKLEKETGYLLTIGDPAKPIVELEDCSEDIAPSPHEVLIVHGVWLPRQ